MLRARPRPFTLVALSPPSTTAFALGSLAATVIVALAAAALRGRLYFFFVLVLCGVHTGLATALYPELSHDAWRRLGLEGLAWPVVLYLQLTVFLHFGSLTRAALRPRLYRALVSMPASFFVAGTLLGWPIAIGLALGLPPEAALVPYAVALFGFFESVRHRPEEVDLTVDGRAVKALARHPRGGAEVSRPLRIVQLTDPHLGPFMSERRLRRLAQRAVDKSPDLVLLTGDFVTMESHEAEAELTHALEPLRALPGRVFACMGNHDHEAPHTVRGALAAVGATLLVDEAAVVDTPAGRVQLVGLDYHFKDRRARIPAVLAAHPRVDGALRLVLLHDPGAFVHIPEGDADLVFSGHTHGGQVGLLSLGLPHTLVSALTKIPDHGYWAHGKNRLYVHRGTGHYGFPLRVGVPAEESLVRVHWTGARDA